MIEMLWVSESCSSLAMRSRSSPARRRAASSRVRSASAARCSASSRYAWRCRVTIAATPAATNQPISSAVFWRSCTEPVDAGQVNHQVGTQERPRLASAAASRWPAQTAANTDTITGKAAGRPGWMCAATTSMQAVLTSNDTRGARRQATSASEPARTAAKSSAPACGV